MGATDLLQRRRQMMASKSLLPSGYKQLEYIINTSDAYINTGVTMADTDTIRIVFQASNTTFFVAGRNASNGQPYMFIMQRVQQWQYRPDTSFNLADGNKHDIAMSAGVVTCDGESRAMTAGSIVYTVSILLFAAWYNTSIDSRRLQGKMFAAQIIDSNGNYRFNGIPAKDANDKVGMYDTVTKRFFTSETSNDFTTE